MIAARAYTHRRKEEAGYRVAIGEPVIVKGEDVATIDGWLEGFLHWPTALWVVLLVSLALGLRHASDPDHLAAVTTLIASEKHGGTRKAGLMGLCWGLGHGTSLVLIGLPLVLLGRYLPESVQQAAETLIGVIIILLGVRLIVRWRRGHFHAHSHDGEPVHRHVHFHESDPSHEHTHNFTLRTPLSSYGIGLVHGIGGSGGLTLLLLSTIPNPAQATGALLIFAGGTGVSMALLSTAFGLAIARGPIGRNFERFTPVLGALSLAFGTWYMLGALGVVAYPL
jgi:ABC-type nickel/cobalt efflux system permease component RcnA